MKHSINTGAIGDWLAMHQVQRNGLATRRRTLLERRARATGHTDPRGVGNVLQKLANTDTDETTLDQDERAALDQFQRDFEGPEVDDPIAALDDDEAEAIARLAGLRPLRPFKVSS